MPPYIKNILKYSIQYACLSHCIFEYIGDFVVCSGPSMEPSIYSKNILITERLTTRFKKLNRGDIIIAVSPTNPEQYICKRVIGLEGDKVTLNEHTPPQKIKNELTIAAYPTLNMDYVPRGFVWIEGDNKNNSSDSRYYGPVPLGLIRSRVLGRIWPLNEMKWL